MLSIFYLMILLSDQERTALEFELMEHSGTYLVPNHRIFTFGEVGNIFVAFSDGGKDVRMSKSRLSVSHTYNSI